MPNYKYKCDCGWSETISESISADPDGQACPECPGIMHRIIIAPRINLKRNTFGEWYKEQTGKELFGDS